MKSDTEVYELLARADPVVDVEVLDTSALITRIERALGHETLGRAREQNDREEPMVAETPTKYERPTPRPPLRPKRVLGVVLGTAALAILIGVGLFLGVFNGDGDAALGEIDAVHAAADGWNAYDADAYVRHWVEGTSGYGPFGPSKSGIFTIVGSPEMQQALDAFRAANGRITLSDCELEDNAVTCVETHDDPRYGGVITLGSRYTFDRDGRISSLTYTNAVPIEVDAFHLALAQWMETNHPEAFNTYFTPSFYSLRSDSWQTPETVAELVPLIEEFIARSEEYPLSP